jgi:TolB-like protein
MSDIFISYARSDAEQSQAVAEALRALGYGVWRDDELPAHRAYAEVIEERLKAAKAVVVMWSADAVKSQWVRAEADVARERGTLVQLSLDGATPPLPFNQIQCADLRGWRGEDHPGWRKIAASVAELLGRQPDVATPAMRSAVRPPERVRIAVVLRPIVMASGADAEGLAAGLSDEIATAMSRSPTLHVLTPLTARADETLDFALDGSLQRAGDRLRLSLRLVFSADGSLLWSERYDGHLADLFGFQDRVAGSVTIGVENALRELEVEKSAGVPEEQLNTRQLYFRSIALLRGADPQSMRDGMRCVERLIALEPGHMHALAIAAMIYFNAWHLGFGEGDADGLRRKAADYALRALRLSDTDPWSCGMSALVLAWVGHPVQVSVAEIDRVLASAPSFTVAWFWSGMIRLRAGDPETAAAHLEHLFAIDPRMPVRPPALCNLGVARILQRRFDEALPLLDESSRLRPGYTAARIFAAVCLGHLGRPEEAGSQLEASRAIAPIEKFRWPTRDAGQRQILQEGLALAGLTESAQMFADIR